MKTLMINGKAYTFNCSSKITKSGLVHTCSILENGFIIHSEMNVYKKGFVSEDYKFRNIILNSINNFIKNSSSVQSKINLSKAKEEL